MLRQEDSDLQTGWWMMAMHPFFAMQAENKEMWAGTSDHWGSWNRRLIAAKALVGRSLGEIRFKRIAVEQKCEDSSKLRRAIEDLSIARAAISDVINELQQAVSPRRDENEDEDDECDHG